MGQEYLVRPVEWSAFSHFQVVVSHCLWRQRNGLTESENGNYAGEDESVLNLANFTARQNGVFLFFDGVRALLCCRLSR